MKGRKFHISPKCVGWEDDSVITAGSSVMAGWGSGKIIYFKGERRAHASPALIWGFRRAQAKGIKLVDDDNLPNPWAYLLYVYRHENSVFIRGDALNILAEAYRKRGAALPLEFRNEDGSIPVDEKTFRDVIENWLGEISLMPSEVMEDVAKLIAAVDRVAATVMGVEEKQFLEAVEQAAAEAAGVPTQKAVHDAWKATGSENMKRETKEAFLNKRDVLGFDWLPPRNPLARKGANP